MPKILLVEDEEDLRMGIADILKFEGFNVVMAKNGVEGLDAAMAHRPDLILCDIMMPDMNGFDFLHRLRQDAAFTLTPFIFVSALDARNDIRKGMSLGADDYLTKPFTREELILAINTRLEKFSGLEHKIRQIIGEIESKLSFEITRLKEVTEEQSSIIEEISTDNESLKKQLQDKEMTMMSEAMNVIETNNIIKNLKDLIQHELQKNNLDTSQKILLGELQTKISRKTMLSDNLTVFQLKFNQVYPHFLSNFSQHFSHLTQYELVMTAAMITGLNTNQIAEMLNISPESVRKSRYRLKKKLGLGKKDDLLMFMQSFNVHSFTN